MSVQRQTDGCAPSAGHLFHHGVSELTLPSVPFFQYDFRRIRYVSKKNCRPLVARAVLVIGRSIDSSAAGTGIPTPSRPGRERRHLGADAPGASRHTYGTG